MWFSRVFCWQSLVRWRLYFLVFWRQLGCHIVSGLGVIKWHFHPKFWEHLYFGMPAACFEGMFSLLHSNSTCLTRCFPVTFLWGIDLQGGAWQARGFLTCFTMLLVPAAALKQRQSLWMGTVWRHVKCDASEDVLQCAGRWVQCTFIAHAALENARRQRRWQNRKWTTVYHSQTFQTVFQCFLWSRCIFPACHGSYIEGHLRIGVVYIFFNSQ